MKRFIIFAIAALSLSIPAVAQNPHYQAGVFTLAPGANNLNDNLPAFAHCYEVAWVLDRPGGAGFMVSNCSEWVSDQGPKGDNGVDGSDGANGLSAYQVAVANGFIGTEAQWLASLKGGNGATGPAGPSVNSFSGYSARTVSLATAYQATNTAKPAIITINLSSSAELTLLGGTTNTADVVVGPTSAVSSGTGTVACRYRNSNTGGLVVGVTVNVSSAAPCVVALPAGWYFAVRQTSGTVDVTSTLEQVVGQ